LSAVIFAIGAGQVALSAKGARQLRRALRHADDPGGHGWDLADRVERAGQLGHTVYPEPSELTFLLGALREIEPALGGTGEELLQAVLAEMR
jgi:hypothetical protein